MVELRARTWHLPPVSSPVLSTIELTEWMKSQRAAGRTVVLTNGCFDILHAGHVDYLERARALGDVLVVAVNSDNSVRALKGPTRPINPEGDRATVIAALRSVDAVTVFDSLRLTPVIRATAPDIYAKGGDYTRDSLDREEFAALEEVGTRIEILPLVPGRSTTAILNRSAQSG